MAGESEMVEQCGNCRFWRERTDFAEGHGGGYCRRFPPSMPSELRGQVTYSPYGFSITQGSRLNDAWPMVHQQEWCGEFDSALSKPQT